jgi:hypothetical protein
MDMKGGFHDKIGNNVQAFDWRDRIKPQSGYFLLQS